MTAGNLWWREGAPCLLKRAPSSAKMVHFVLEGRLYWREALQRFWKVPHLLVRAPSRAERAFFCAKGESSLVRGTQYILIRALACT